GRRWRGRRKRAAPCDMPEGLRQIRHARGIAMSTRNKLAVIASTTLIVGLSALLVASQHPAGAAEAQRPEDWEHKAVSFGPSEEDNTNKLNALAADGWEYVGLLASGNDNGLRGMVAFRRRVDLAAAKKEGEKLLGRWKVVGAEAEGEKVEADGEPGVWRGEGRAIEFSNGDIGSLKLNPIRKRKA